MAIHDTQTDRISDQGTAEFLRLYSAHQSRIFAYIFTLLPNWHDSEEVFQEMSVVLWRAFRSFQPGTDFRAWAFKVAFNQVLTYRKLSKRAAVLPGPEVMEAIASEVSRDSATLDAQLAALAGCVEKLPPHSREILDRCYQQGARTRQVALEMGRPEGTIYKSLTRIRQWLFDCIQRSVAMEHGR
jgi:RNA polymerase sigma-70 factor (ECF subfamily)